MKLFIIFLLLFAITAQGQSDAYKKVSYIPLPKWVDTTQGVIENAHVHLDQDGTCLYDSLGHLVRVESGSCRLIEMVYDKGVWIPWSRCSYCKPKANKDTSKQQVKGVTYPYTTSYVNEGKIVVDTPKTRREVDRNHVYTIQEDKNGN